MPPIPAHHHSRIGATPLDGDRCRFRVWAPRASGLAVRILGPRERTVPLAPQEDGYYEAVVESAPPGTLYAYRFEDGRERPDPATRFQPQGVHGPSQVVSDAFEWHDRDWRGLPLEDYVLYELHVGAFTEEGTFEAIVPHLDGLKELGVTALELMPVAQFPGRRNWGYDGVYQYAPQDSYGGPEGLRRLVDACHQRGMAVALDVVFNHLGPEGNYLPEFGPYLTDAYKTGWGCALNYDGPHSDEVRNYFIGAALHWLFDFHIDMLRLDAIDNIRDPSAYPFLAELVDAVRERGEHAGRKVYLVAETSNNDPALLRSREQGGVGMDGQWLDEFHHCVHTLLTGERGGYYQDFGQVSDLLRAYRDGYVMARRYSPYRKRTHGLPAPDVAPQRFVVCSQNHDQIGNRAVSDRLTALVGFEALKLAAGAVILSPFTPLLFMGEEYGEKNPFTYFVDHSDPQLAEAVRRGRLEEFAAFAWQGEIPDPTSEETFRRAKLDRSQRQRQPGAALYAFYKRLLELRRTVPAFRDFDKSRIVAQGFEGPRVVLLRRGGGAGEVCVIMHFGGEPTGVSLPIPSGRWSRLVDSADARWGGPGGELPERIDSPGEARLQLGPHQFAVYLRQSGS